MIVHMNDFSRSIINTDFMVRAHALSHGITDRTYSVAIYLTNEDSRIVLEYGESEFLRNNDLEKLAVNNTRNLQPNPV